MSKPKTLTIMLLSGSSENEDPIFAVRLAEAALRKGHKVNLFLYGNGVNLTKSGREISGKRTRVMSDILAKHIKSRKIDTELEMIAGMGANIATCHTSEYARGIESLEYLKGIKEGHVGQTFCDFLTESDRLIVLKH